MEDGVSSSLQHASSQGLSASPSFSAMLQRVSMIPQAQGSSQTAMIQHSEDSHSGMSPTSMSIALSNHNRAEASGMRLQLLKKKRGRPRKYAEGADGNNNISLALLSPGPSAEGPLSSNGEKRRGRPPGSGKKQHLAALGSAGQGFTPHVITIAAGEDVATKIMSFSQIGSRALCVLSANGAISNVTLRQTATSGGTVTYEGRFEILSLSGSFLLTEDSGTRSRTGGLSVSLAGPDGRVVGGGVAGMLTAASPVQVVVGSFIAEGRKTHARITSGASGHAANLSAAPGVPSTRVTPFNVVHPGKANTSVTKSPIPPFDGGADSDTSH
ncbi:hypothetical protein O6H91_23G019500 [Diphasiastrum complanatum]|uniref:Uncharacterized protein n=1 Tax=Diphasiastrum complanatum TaxID=34168 RepID=A0ACC2AAL7_DIPCM|nr:hypothetical protein O6H91_23G019500 [Diphasiastrum complanatum]